MSFTHEQMIEKFAVHEGKPYSVNVHSEERIRMSNAGDFLQVDQSSSHFFQDEKTSCEFNTLSYPGEPPWSSFSRRSDGLMHTVRELKSREDLTWECELWEMWPSPYPPVVIYSGNGWNVFSQARLLLVDLGPGEMESSGDGMELTWQDFPERVREEMSSSFGNPLSNTEVLKEITLRIDPVRGEPMFIGVYFSSGNSTETTFSEIIFLDGEYAKSSAELEARLGVPDSFKCECDYSEPFRIVKRRERAVPK